MSHTLSHLLRTSWFFAFLGAILVFICYVGSISGAFVFDDLTGIVHKTAITHPTGLAQIWEANPSRFFANLSFAANYRYGGQSVIWYHLMNMIIHWGAGIAVYGWIVELTRKRSLALFVAMLFLVHPLQTEAVAYISQRTTALAAFWYLSSLWAWTRYLRRGMADEDVWLILLAYLCQIAALLTKEYTYSLPFLILGTGIFLFRNDCHCERSEAISKDCHVVSLLAMTVHIRKSELLRRFLLALGIFFALTAMTYVGARMVLITRGLQAGALPVSQTTAALSPLVSPQSYFLTQGGVLLRYLGLLLVPIGQTADHHLPFIQSAWSPLALAAWMVVTVLLVIALRIRRRVPLISFGILFFFATISLESSVFPIEDAMVEHRLYLPSIGIFLAVGVLIEMIRRSQLVRPWLLASLLAILMLGSMLLTQRRVMVWTSSGDLWQDVVAKSPDSARGHFNLGGALIEAGYTLQGIFELRTAARLDPRLAPAVKTIEQLVQKEGTAL